MVEIRLYGPAKKFSKDAIYAVAKKFRVKGNTRKRSVPHVTLYGPFSTEDVPRLMSSFKKICEKYAFREGEENLVMYAIGGFKSFDGASGKVICLDIKPSPKLVGLTTDLANELNSFCEGQPWDRRGDKLFHATIAFRDVGRKHGRIMRYLSGIRAPLARYPLLRVTVIRPGRKILCEYDLIQNRLLNRDDALNRDLFRKTISEVRRILPEESVKKPKGLPFRYSKKRGKGNVAAQKRRWRARRKQKLVTRPPHLQIPK